jgi:hypothetical protein
MLSLRNSSYRPTSFSGSNSSLPLRHHLSVCYSADFEVLQTVSFSKLCSNLDAPQCPMSNKGLTNPTFRHQFDLEPGSRLVRSGKPIFDLYRSFKSRHAIKWLPSHEDLASTMNLIGRRENVGSYLITIPNDQMYY